MQVQAVNNNQTSFGAIYQPKNNYLNKVQKPIAEAIKKAMREPLQKFKGETAEGFYKSKGLDFEIAPRGSETVTLSAYKGLKETGVGVDRGHTYSDRLYIGEYDKNSEFRISDIETGIKDKKGKNLGFMVAALTAISGFLFIAIMPDRQITRETVKPLIENIDSTTNKTKAILPILEDSLKFGKKVIKK